MSLCLCKYLLSRILLVTFARILAVAFGMHLDCFLFCSHWILRDKMHTAGLEKDEGLPEIDFALFACAPGKLVR